MAVPAIIHQLWKTADVPARFTPLRESWRRLNPDWEIRLWTDADLDALVETRYPDLIGVYRGYKEAICRADLGRYLVLESFGGLYADLDCECLKPIAPLVDGAELLIGLEPEAHLQEAIVVESGFGLGRLLCPSFIASRPAHPFWAHVRRRVADSRHLKGPLNLTGPFMLTRAHEDYDDPAPVTIVASPVLYPFSKGQCWGGEVHDLEAFERCSRDAYAAHYWDGGWFRRPTPLDLPWEAPVRLSAGPAADYPPEASAVRITCLTLADGDLEPAIDSYLRQTHPNKELIVVAGAATPPLPDHVRARPDIRCIDVEDAAATPAERRGIGVAAASGDLVCRWDAGELQDSQRLEVELHLLMQTGAQAGLLARRLMWRPAERRMAITASQPDPATLICLKACWPGSGEIDDLLAVASAVTIDLPRLSLERAPEGDAFEAAWGAAAARFEGERCDAVAAQLAKRLPLRLLEPPPRPRPARARSPHGEILILTPIKDGRPHLPRYFELVSRLVSGGAPLSIAFLEGDSRDGTYEALEAALPSLESRFSRIEAYQRPDGLELTGPRWRPEAQLGRRAAIARARNRLLAAALGDAEWVLWLDVDLIDVPPDLILQLLAAGEDIVAPHCKLPDGRSFDLNTFVFTGDGDDAADLCDGLYQPARGKGRLYLEDLTGHGPVKVDSVGGAALLVRGELHRQGLNFPAYSYRGYIETEGFAMMARDIGASCWALPALPVVHAP